MRIFQKNLGLLKKQYQTEAIHDLRVSVKKLRAYLRLLRRLSKEIDHRLKFEETEQLFNLLGKHRDIEMGIQVLKKFEKKSQENYSFLSDHLQAALQRSYEWIQPALANYDTHVMRELTLELQDDLKNSNDAEMGARVRANIEKDLARSSKHTSQLDQHPHQVRKLFKDVLYQAEVCPRDHLPAHLPIGKIKKILDRLGDWQDHEMLLKKIKHFRKDFIPSSREEFDVLKQLEKEISEKKQQLLNSCMKIFKE